MMDYRDVPEFTLSEHRRGTPFQQPQEMVQRSPLPDTFFSLKRERTKRPSSVATEFVDTDWDDDDILSDNEAPPLENSPRHSLKSAGQHSITTLSSYDEASTPRSSRGHQLPISYPEMTEQPTGAHRDSLTLFRSPSLVVEDEDHVLTLSPVTPSTAKVPSTGRSFDDSVVFNATAELAELLRHGNGPFKFTSTPLNSANLVSWTPVMVAQSMLNAGVEFCFAEKFVDNDINGSIMTTLKFEDLKELQISSFGMRTKIWNQILILKDCKLSSPLPPTPIEDCPSDDLESDVGAAAADLKRRKTARKMVGRKPFGNHLDVVSPMESVSIVGIEQVIPKPHNCAKGEACAKFRKQRRLIEAFQKEHPLADMEAGVLIAGNPGNPNTAPRIDLDQNNEMTMNGIMFRPQSEAATSIVASSDVMGPGSLPPLQYLKEATLQSIQKRDPQDNVKQFLAFQQSQPITDSEVPSTPSFDIPTSQNPHQNLRSLPRLAIPTKSPLRQAQAAADQQQQKQQQQQQQQHVARPRTTEPATPSQKHRSFIPYTKDKASPAVEELQSANPYRFGTPFSEMDVPVTQVSLGPVARDASQSVPPDMSYRAPQPKPQPPSRSMSRTSSRRPSFPVLPALEENRVAQTAPLRISKTPSPTRQQERQQQQQQAPLKAPPRVNYPWSPIERSKPFETAIAPFPAVTSRSVPVKELAARSSTDTAATTLSALSHQPGEAPAATSYQGTMRKRKTHFLRHEWQEGFFTLRGTRLAMHKDAGAAAASRTLEYVDIDDYAVACSSMGSQSKLTAAFRAVQLRSNNSGFGGGERSEKKDLGAFAFQLVPQGKEGGAKLRKRESFHFGGSSSSSGNAIASGEGVNGTGKTHHFAVKSRDQRIDWMRELMLAKALKQKGEGYEVCVNGNMI